MAQQIVDINNSPLFTELTAEEAASVNGGNAGCFPPQGGTPVNPIPVGYPTNPGINWELYRDAFTWDFYI